MHKQKESVSCTHSAGGGSSPSGCTEPVAVALCVAKATEVLGKCPETITARLSANILKNAMGVGIPGTGMIGLPIAIALGP